jgi:malonyl CoA-acyl carrier protein transacylase
MRDRGAERFVEVGPGRVLTGLVKRTLKDVELAHA